MIEKKLRTLIIEDYLSSKQNLENIIQSNIPIIEIVGSCDSVSEGIKSVNILKPDLILLDIQIIGGNGFDVVINSTYRDFFTIIISGFEEYALEAFKISAIDYLIKPVSSKELIEAIDKINRMTTIALQYEKYDVLKEELNKKTGKIVLSACDCHIVTEIENIIRFEVHDNLTTCYLLDKRSITMAKTLKFFTEFLEKRGFFRVSNNHLVNFEYIERFNRQAHTIKMVDNIIIPISRYVISGFKSEYKSFWKIKRWV